MGVKTSVLIKGWGGAGGRFLHFMFRTKGAVGGRGAEIEELLIGKSGFQFGTPALVDT